MLLIHRTLPDHAPEYTEQRVSLRQPVWLLCPNEHNLFCVPHTWRHWGDRAFSPNSMERAIAASGINIYDYCWF